MSNAFSKEQKQPNDTVFEEQSVIHRGLEPDILDFWMAMDVNEKDTAWDNYTQEEKHELLKLINELTNVIHSGFAKYTVTK